MRPHLAGVTQSTLAQAFNLLGIFAGSILASSYGVFSEYPWALLVFPGLLSNRGAIGGLFSGRLSTGLHLGMVLPRFRENTRDAYVLFSSVVTLTALSAFLLAVGGCVFSVFRYGFDLVEMLVLVRVIFVTLALSILVISPVTFFTSVQAFNRGLDPDMVVYPITSTTADISISFIYVAVLRLVLEGGMGFTLFSGVLMLVFIFGSLWIHFRNLGEAEYVETIREFTGTLLLVTLIVTLTGYMLGRISEKIGGSMRVYTIYPAMIDTVGDVGSIIGSTATTKLSLGYFPAELGSIRSHLDEIFYAWSGSLILFNAYALVSGLMYGFAGFGRLLAVVWWTNLLVIPLIALVSFGVGIVTFQRGLNPDNFVIPFETSLADSLTTLVLYLMIVVWF